MSKWTKIILPFGILAVLLSVAVGIRSNPPDSPERYTPAEPAIAVTALPVSPRQYQIVLESYGAVQPRTQTTLTAQVEGQIVYVNPNIRDGGFFEKDDVLVSIDDRDYVANVRIAEAVLMDARQGFADAEARTEQAREDWMTLGKNGEPPALVLRMPQLEAARARVISAEATLSKAQLELERTRIVAPFDGRVLEQVADIGQVVTENTDIAVIYATDIVEVRLPIRNRDLAFMDLPVSYSDEQASPDGLPVQIASDLLGGSSWDARLIRTEGAIDQSARQLHVVAQIDRPFARRADSRPQLKIGQYVTAQVPGHTLLDALVIPNSAIYQGSYVYIVQEDTLQRRDVEIAWQNGRDAIIGNGLAEGDILVTTPLGQVTSGVRVNIVDEGSPALANEFDTSASQTRDRS